MNLFRIQIYSFFISHKWSLNILNLFYPEVSQNNHSTIILCRSLINCVYLLISAPPMWGIAVLYRQAQKCKTVPMISYMSIHCSQYSCSWFVNTSSKTYWLQIIASTNRYTGIKFYTLLSNVIIPGIFVSPLSAT